MLISKLATSRWAVTLLVLLLHVNALTNNYVDAWSISSSSSSRKNKNIHRSTARSASIVRRQANVATEILISQIKEDEERKASLSAVAEAEVKSSPSTESKQKSQGTNRRRPRSERKSLEREKKARNLKNKNNKNNNKQSKNYKLHSTAVSQLTDSSTADDVVKAIKRAQKNHDHHDLRVIANFLIDECDIGFGYGYRGSLLARLTVAALRWENHDVARRAIHIRRLEYRASIQPMESAAIIRGLLRIHNVTDALNMIADELSLPMDVSTVQYNTSVNALIDLLSKGTDSVHKTVDASICDPV